MYRNSILDYKWILFKIEARIFFLKRVVFHVLFFICSENGPVIENNRDYFNN